jgi:hypothetical protein
MNTPMYQPYPGGAQIPEVRRPTAPPSLQKAVRFMYTGSALSIIGIAVNITAAHATARSILTHDHKSLTATQISQAADGVRVVYVIVGLIAAVVWLWLARSSLAGRNWARITGTVLFGLATIENLDLFAFKTSLLVHLFGLLVWLVGLGAVIFLWRRDSTAYLKPPPPSAPAP